MKPTNSKNKNMRAYEEAMARGEFREDLAIAATIEQWKPKNGVKGARKSKDIYYVSINVSCFSWSSRSWKNLTSSQVKFYKFLSFSYLH